MRQIREVSPQSNRNVWKIFVWSVIISVILTLVVTIIVPSEFMVDDSQVQRRDHHTEKTKNEGKSRHGIRRRPGSKPKQEFTNLQTLAKEGGMVSTGSYHDENGYHTVYTKGNVEDSNVNSGGNIVVVHHGNNQHKTVQRRRPQQPKPQHGVRFDYHDYHQNLQSILDATRQHNGPSATMTAAKEFYHREGITFDLLKNSTTNGSASHDRNPQNQSQPVFTHHVSWKDYNKDNKIVAFYNVFIGKHDLYPNIVEEQISLMNMTGLLDILDVVYYVTIGDSFDSIPIWLRDILTKTSKVKDRHGNPLPENSSSPMFVQVRNTPRLVDETLTLSYLYDFCLLNPDSKVLYFHNKGSYNYRGENVFFRQFLDCYVLNPQCVDALEEGFDTCGWRLSPMPSPHYSGNFWWAKCSYINTLVSPLAAYFNKTFAMVTNNLPSAIVSSDRYFAESWVASHPQLNPADCMDHTIDTTFLCCYDIEHLPIAVNVTSNISTKSNGNNHHPYHKPLQIESQLLCPNHAKQFVSDKNKIDDIKTYDKLIRPLIDQKMKSLLKNSAKGRVKIGSSCKAADVYTNGQYYTASYYEKRGPVEYSYRLDIMDALVRRSYLWYGQAPQKLLAAIDQLDVVPILPNRTFIVNPSAQNTLRYYYNEGRIYPPDSLGFELAEREYQMEQIHRSKNGASNSSSGFHIEKVAVYDFLVKRLGKFQYN